MITLADLIRAFAGLLQPHPDNAALLDEWLETARACDLPHLHSFTRGLDQDTDAVHAALTLPFHNGGTEGVNNTLTGGHRNDVTQLIPLIEAIPPVRGKVGRPRRRPDVLLADRGYDHDKYRRLVRAKGITPVIGRRQTPHGSGLGRHRWVVEQTLAPLHWFCRLRIRWEIRADIHQGFLALAAALICWRRLQPTLR
ncbi:hypothetical protein GCM10010411_92500 [Actinomadura fulvescens]|uniref:Transposase IS4-like domain-containing protein n=1 Tax=Actinomadura fulvescens TaxID=46160 RepID=A0ABP6D800_9ACTN